MAKFFPYKIPGDPNADVDVHEAVRLRPEEIDEALHDADFKTFPRNYHIRKDDLIKHGYTAKCPGCLAAIQGKRAQALSRECRLRIEEEIERPPKGHQGEGKIYRGDEGAHGRRCREESTETFAF